MSDYSITMRCILEIRLKERVFSFLDYRGELIDFLVANSGGKKVRYSNNGSRVDVATDDLKKVIFLGIGNFGIQLETVDKFEDFKDEAKKLLDLIGLFGKYKFKNISRLGVKSVIYCHKKGKGLDSMRSFYRGKMLKGSEVLEKSTGTKVIDFGYTFNDVEIGGSKANITTGPVNGEEAIVRFFEGDENYNIVIKNPGIIYVIDCYRDNMVNNLNSVSIIEEINNNIDYIQKAFEGFRDYIFKESEVAE